MENQKKTIKDYLDENGYFKEQTTLVVALFDQDDIYRGKAEETFSAGTCPPTLPVIELPPEDMKPEKNQVIRWDGKQYYLDYNFKGQTVYKKTTGEAVKIETIGALPDDLTEKERPDFYHTWSDNLKNWWISPENAIRKNQDETETEKSRLITLSEQRVNDLTEATDESIFESDEIDPADLELLKQWKRYRVFIKRVDTTNPVWPELPEPEKGV